MGSENATQIAIAAAAALLALFQLVLTMFSGSRVEHLRAQHMANLASALPAVEREAGGSLDAAAVEHLRSELRLATMQYRVARLTLTSLRPWVLYWLLLATIGIGSWWLLTTDRSEGVASTPGDEPLAIVAIAVIPVFLHYVAAYATRRRQRPGIAAVDPGYLTIDPPHMPGSAAEDTAGWLPRRLARDLWQEDRRARHDVRRRALQPRVAFWSIRLTSIVTGVLSGVALSFLIATALNRLVQPDSTGARDAAVLSVVALPWLVLVYWTTWLIVERPWNIRAKDPEGPSGTSGSDTPTSSAWIVLGAIATLLGRSPKKPDRADSATTP